MTKILVTGFASLVVGVAIGFSVRYSRTAEGVIEPSEEVPRVVAESMIADQGETATIAALRARVQELEAQVARRRERRAPTNEVARVRENRGNREPSGMRELMDSFRQANPEGFNQASNFFARIQRNRQEAHESKLNFLASVDVSRMSDAARQTHENVQNLLVAREEILQELMSPDLDWSARGEAMGRVRAVNEELQRENAAERANLLRETARVAGVSDELAEDFVSTVNGIISATEDENPMRMGGGRNGGPRQRRGNR